MRKGRDGEKDEGKKWEKKEKTDENSGHYVIASRRPPERRLLERRTLAPINCRPQEILAPKRFFAPQKFFIEKNLGPKIFVPKDFWSIIIREPKKFVH